MPALPIIVTSLITGALTWVVNGVLSSPAQLSASVASVTQDVAVLKNSDTNQNAAIRDVKDNIEYIRRVVEEQARRQGIVIKQ